ncbi:M20/M25/M40 family metallo-hydrolase [uncultured Algoriphagus sp.]|uniref:M20/M25/M40 family metallo-hydrolase n=1 Tax=uncultured Algoriphagus sp. TaxID=417365 RepID=UPI00258D28B8|nr:M20/M25/M40 family metallo-hydrolase [uncultured Algoriphagus sp.]
MRNSFLAAFFFVSQLTFGQLSRTEIIASSESNLRASLLEFREYLSLPNNGKIADDISLNLKWTQAALGRLGFQTQILTGNGIPHLFAQGEIDPKKKTILVYMQVDGQPVDSSAWNQESPFIPELKEEKDGNWRSIPWSSLDEKINPKWKIFARSASDSKGPTMAFFSALEILKEKGIEPSVNLKFILDFQEEISSPELAPIVAANKDLFQADGILIMDGTRHFSNLPNLTFGARGIVTATIRVFGASNNLHSGQYGNFAPNPVFQLSRLITAMKDESGRVLIPGFYDGVSISETDFKTMSEVPEDNEAMALEMGFAEAEKVGRNYQEALQYPSLNIRGISAGWTGKEVRTLIPSEAVVEIDMRTVKETPNERQLALLRHFILDQGFYLIEGDEPTEFERKTYSKIASFQSRNGSQPFRSAMESDFAKWLDRGMSHVFGEKYIKTRQTGGSQPMAPFINILGVPAVSVRIPNPDNNIHGPNENIRIGNYLEGIQTCLGILTQVF